MPQHCHGRLRLTNEPSARQRFNVRQGWRFQGFNHREKVFNQGYGVVFVVMAISCVEPSNLIESVLLLLPTKDALFLDGKTRQKAGEHFFRTWATISSKLWKQILKLKQFRCEWTLRQRDSNQRTKWPKNNMNQHTNCWKKHRNNDESS